MATAHLQLHELGPDTAATELEWLRFALRRLAGSGPDPALNAATLSSAVAAAAGLDALLVDPVLPEVGDASPG